MAANRTVDDSFRAHSLHCYFIEQGLSISRLLPHRPFQPSPSAPSSTKSLVSATAARSPPGIPLDLTTISFSLVKARQNGKTVCTCSVSYQKPEPDSIFHQQDIPDLPPPEECEDARDFLKR